MRDDTKQWQEDEEMNPMQDKEEFYSEINRKGNTNQNPANFANDQKKAQKAGRKGGSKWNHIL